MQIIIIIQPSFIPKHQPALPVGDLDLLLPWACMTTRLYSRELPNVALLSLDLKGLHLVGTPNASLLLYTVFLSHLSCEPVVVSTYLGCFQQLRIAPISANDNVTFKIVD